MLLTVDVGNTNITLGLFKEDKVFATFRMNTQMVKTSDEYGSTIAELIARKNININEIENVIISSVVPKVMYSLNNGIIKYFGIKPIIVGPGTKTGIRELRELIRGNLVQTVLWMLWQHMNYMADLVL